MERKNNKKKKGFTLIELIIVVAIIGILSAIAIPKFGSAQKDAKISADKANAKIIADATTLLITKGELRTDDEKNDGSKYTVDEKYEVKLDNSTGNPGNLIATKLQKVPKVQNGIGNFYVLIDKDENVKVYKKVGEKYEEAYPNYEKEIDS